MSSEILDGENESHASRRDKHATNDLGNDADYANLSMKTINALLDFLHANIKVAFKTGDFVVTHFILTRTSEHPKGLFDPRDY